MFVAPRSILPKDFTFPSSLKELGYCVNENDELRSINDPQQPFRYRVNVNDRYNEVRKEAVNGKQIKSFLSSYDRGMFEMLPHLTVTMPHVPILVTPSIFTNKRVIVVFGDPTQDLGIWACRIINQQTINSGSAVDFAKEVLQQEKEGGGQNDDDDKSRPGLLIANLGQLTWYCHGQKAVSLATWEALPRESAVEPSRKMTARNVIPQNKTWNEHVDYIFREVLGKMVPQTTKFDVIGVAEGCIGTVNYLSENWEQWKTRISAICMADPPSYMPYNCTLDLLQYLGKRSRAYVMSNKPINTPVPGYAQFGVNCYSAGENEFAEHIVPRAYKSMVKWLNIMHANPALEEKPLVLNENVAVDGGHSDQNEAQGVARIEEIE
ncbi:hypothetical protein KEM54_004892 [Ascosphaera aggregata]|nr:hypothetical protein KEM54_004892 [Ascosphaera aggregata]